MPSRHLLTASALILLSACSSNQAPKEMDHTLNTRTQDPREQVGLRDDKVVIQKKVYLEEQLWSLKSEVDDLQHAVYGKSQRDPGGIWLGLRECRRKVSDPRIGGSGKPEPMETWTNITQADESFFFQMDKKTNNLVGVSEEALDERLQKYKSHKRVLETAYTTMRDKLESCEDTYRTALVQHGINPDDGKAQGEWVDGPKGYRVWRMKRPSTTDPEEMMRRKNRKERKASEEG